MWNTGKKVAKSGVVQRGGEQRADDNTRNF